LIACLLKELTAGMPFDNAADGTKRQIDIEELHSHSSVVATQGKTVMKSSAMWCISLAITVNSGYFNFSAAQPVSEETTACQTAPQNLAAGDHAAPLALKISRSGPEPPPAIAPFDTGQARKHQEAWAKHLGIPVEWTNSIGMKFVLIPPGEFMMGSGGKRIQWGSGETPQHQVRITQPFFLGALEVTQEQYTRVMGGNPSYFSRLLNH
jgi:formylglycine-generating enzyme required for sulfatase activity